MSTIIDKLEKAQIKRHPQFGPGDRVRVHFQVIEGSRRRTQVFEGIVLKRQGSGARETFTVRKHSFGVGVERTFPVHSTKIEQIEVAARGEVRRAKLYYLRGRVGKGARVRERAWTPAEQAMLDADATGAYDAEGSQDEAELVAPEEAPVDEAATDEAANDEAANDDAPKDEAAAEAAPAEDAKSEDAPADEPADEPAAEKTEDAPAAEAPAAEAADEAPADDAAGDDAPAADGDAES